MIAKVRTTERSGPLSVSFVVPTLNEAATLPCLLRSINLLHASEKLEVLEVIVVDAASTDGTQDIARAADCKVVQARPGCAGASRNLGAARASGAVLAFVDADCELPANWLLQVGLELEREDVVAVGSSMALSPEANRVEAVWYALVHHAADDEASESVRWLASFNLATQKSTFDALGGFDESLETGEDAEFSYRLASLGDLRRLHQSRVIHHGESKTTREFYLRERWRARGAIKLLKTHWKDPKELISFIIPVAIIGGLLLAMVLGIASAWRESGPLLAAALACASLALAPIAVVIGKKRVPLRHIPYAVWLLLVYMAARCVGLMRAFERVERPALPKQMPLR